MSENISAAKITGWITLGIILISAVFSMFTYVAPASAVADLKLEHADFVTSGQFQEYVLSDMYDSYYDFLDRLMRYEDEENQEMVLSIERQLARLRAKICAQDPSWEECIAFRE